jgi:hydroxymethylglutaryl-CoA reductase
MPEQAKKKFYQLTQTERLDTLAEQAGLTADDLADLSANLSADTADYMIENVVGVHGLPLGIAQNFIVNGRPVFVPMAIEEPSVVAGASFMAKLARPAGGFRASASQPEMIGQIQLLDLADPPEARNVLLRHKDELLAMAGEVNPVMADLGGGPRGLEVRLIPESPIGAFLVIHLIYDVRDAMGANMVNTAAEHLAPRIEALTGGRVHLTILSNLSDRRLAKAEVTIYIEDLAFGEYSGEQVRDGVIEAWAFAAADPYRAATHNKGIMNGVDAVVMATANDWRAVEAGAHAYAARSGRYTSLSTWAVDAHGNLSGSLEMPMAVGIVGGATRAHPGARACLKLMGVKTAGELAGIIVSVGLAQNLAALRALATEGIQKGHMALHARKDSLG